MSVASRVADEVDVKLGHEVRQLFSLQLSFPICCDNNCFSLLCRLDIPFGLKIVPQIRLSSST